jgi:hypothetical protein
MHVKETITTKLHTKIRKRQFFVTEYCMYVRKMPEIMNVFIKGNENVMLTGRGQERFMKWT